MTLQEVGAILYFGAFVKEVNPGLLFVPFFSCKLVKVTGLTTEMQIPGEPEDVFDPKENIEGTVRKIFATHKEKMGTDDPLDRRLTTEPSAYIRFRVKRGSVENFLERIGSIEEAERQIRDANESEIKVIFARNTVKETLKNLEKINGKLLATTINLVEDWGIELLRVQIVDLGLSHNTNKKIDEAVQAEFEKRATITLAEAERRRLEEEGEGTALAVQVLLEAQAVGYNAIAEELEIKDKELVLRLQLIKEALKDAKYSIIPGSQVFEMAAGLTEIIEKIKIQD